jgi:hypothetical protein
VTQRAAWEALLRAATEPDYGSALLNARAFRLSWSGRAGFIHGSKMLRSKASLFRMSDRGLRLARIVSTSAPDVRR